MTRSTRCQRTSSACARIRRSGDPGGSGGGAVRRAGARGDSDPGLRGRAASPVLRATNAEPDRRAGQGSRAASARNISDRQRPVRHRADGAAYTQRDDVACLNRYFYADLEQRLEATTGQVRGLLEHARGAASDRLAYMCTELMAYLLVERCYWHFISQPLPALRFDAAVMSEAASLLAAALEGAKERRDWLRWHRIAANQARLGYMAGDSSPTLPRTFDKAMALGQLCLDHGFAVDRAFVSRRDELLHM